MLIFCFFLQERFFGVDAIQKMVEAYHFFPILSDMFKNYFTLPKISSKMRINRTYLMHKKARLPLQNKQNILSHFVINGF